MREGLKQSLLADGFGDGSDPHCLLIHHEQFEEFWKWTREHNVDCRPVPMGTTHPSLKFDESWGYGVEVSPNKYMMLENRDLHNCKVVFIPDSVKYCFPVKLRWN